MRILLISLSLLLSTQSFALIIPDEYRSGREICKSTKRPKEHEIWLKVPVDYDYPERGRTDLFAWTNKPFDPLKKTVVFVSGGPGDTAHKSHLELQDWNVIFFDQRGNSCSRPATKELYLDPTFYSSEKTARDIEEIRKKLGIQKISVYGVSYGTVVAHLYGHHFPESTRAIVLEGVVFQGGIPLMRPQSRTRTLQLFFDSLPALTQERILEISNDPFIAKNWFSKVGAMMLYMDDSLMVYKTFLNNILFNDAVLYPVLKTFEYKEATDEEFGYGHVMMGMIGCQELGMNLKGISFYSVFQERKLVSDNFNDLDENYCVSLGLESDEFTNLYDAGEKLSISATTYIQGSMDGATSAEGALLHYKLASKGFSQFVLVDQGGHAPLHGPVSSGYERGQTVELRLEVLRTALLGEKISDEKLAKLSESSSLSWTHR